MLHCNSALILSISALLVSAQANAQVVSVTLDGRDGPWLFTPGGLNTAFQYGLNDQLPPLVLGPANGFNFTPGGVFAISYVSGTVVAGIGFPAVNAAGVQTFQTNGNIGNSGGFFPSKYFNSTEYPSFLVELVGTFANDTGAVVGTPFEIGLSRSVTIPAGATRLQLGINDDIFNDNTGAFNIMVSLTAVPEPSSLVLIMSAAGAGGLWHRRRTRK